MSRIRVGEDDVVATLAHPLWVTGTGWGLAQHLETGDRIHGIPGTVPVVAIEDAGEADAFNLIVDDFHTYFVGFDGLLAHDNTPIRPAFALVPGLSR